MRHLCGLWRYPQYVPRGWHAVCALITVTSDCADECRSPTRGPRHCIYHQCVPAPSGGRFKPAVVPPWQRGIVSDGGARMACRPPRLATQPCTRRPDHACCQGDLRRCCGTAVGVWCSTARHRNQCGSHGATARHHPLPVSHRAAASCRTVLHSLQPPTHCPWQSRCVGRFACVRWISTVFSAGP